MSHSLNELGLKSGDTILISRHHHHFPFIRRSSFQACLFSLQPSAFSLEYLSLDLLAGLAFQFVEEGVFQENGIGAEVGIHRPGDAVEKSEPKEVLLDETMDGPQDNVDESGLWPPIRACSAPLFE